MKKLIGFTAIYILGSLAGYTTDQHQGLFQEDLDSAQFRTIKHQTFQPGEKLKYSVNYGWMTAGEATLEVKKAPQKINGREIYHMIGTGISVNTFDWFFKVRDKYETYMDADGVFPWVFVRRINEGGYSKAQDYQFFQHKKMVRNQKAQEFNVPVGVQDMLSAFYYARTLDFSKAKKGDIFTIPAFVDEEYYDLKIKYAGTDKIKVNKGKFDCMVFHPVVQTGRIFNDEEDLTVYITNDKNKIPVLAKAKILVGSIRMELEDYSGLANPVAKLD
ncbi:DUF3108 domain-containing protein [bacterium]|nr:DUF3108 domain-containing protein [bacterium]